MKGLSGSCAKYTKGPQRERELCLTRRDEETERDKQRKEVHGGERQAKQKEYAHQTMAYSLPLYYNACSERVKT